MALKKIELPRVRLADVAYEQIVNAIVNDEIERGRKIAQEKLAERLGISRTPLREALFRLEKEGILTMSGKGGFLIRSLTPEEVRDIYQTRSAIEGHAAMLLAERADPRVIRAIRAVIESQASRELVSAADIYDANRLIHRAFVEHTGNAYLLEMFDMMWNRALSLHMFSAIELDLVRRTLTDHHALCDALEPGDGPKGADAMRQHIENGMRLQLADTPSE